MYVAVDGLSIRLTTIMTIAIRKSIYADDICCAFQAKSFTEIESTLSADLTCLAEYCQTELSVSMYGQLLKHEHLPVYLGVTLDLTLSYRQHLQKTAAKVISRNNLLSKLAGSSWGTDTVTLRTSAIALGYSVAESYHIISYHHIIS